MKKIIPIITSTLALAFLGYLAFEVMWRAFGYSQHDPLVPLLGIVMILIWSTVVQQIVGIKDTIHVVWSWVMIQRYRENPDQFVPQPPQEQKPELN